MTIEEWRLNAAVRAYDEWHPMPPTDSVSRGYVRDLLGKVLEAVDAAKGPVVQAASPPEVVTQPHHTSAPDAAQIERDGYVVTQRLTTREERNQLLNTTADEVGVMSGPRFTNS